MQKAVTLTAFSAHDRRSVKNANPIFALQKDGLINTDYTLLQLIQYKDGYHTEILATSKLFSYVGG